MVYEEGSLLAPHMDQLALVSSAIINVAQGVDDPWLLETYCHDCKAYNVIFDVSDMLLYDSHSVINGKFQCWGKT